MCVHCVGSSNWRVVDGLMIALTEACLGRCTARPSSTCLNRRCLVRDYIVPRGNPTILATWVEMIGMHATKDRPVVVDGQIVIRPVMIVALTYDHRLLDGREAVTFLGA
jgi:hypothetical protein